MGQGMMPSKTEKRRGVDSMALAKGRRGDLGHRRFLIRPLGLAESQWAPAVAGLCGLALVTVAVLEIMTPNDVVASVGLLPLVRRSGRFPAGSRHWFLCLPSFCLP